MTASQAAEQDGLVPELRTFVEQAEAQIREVADLMEPLTEKQIDWRPGPERWSIGENIAHLTLSNRPYLDELKAAIERARERGLWAEPPYRHGWMGNWFVRSMEPPPRFRARTLRRLVPQRRQPKDTVLADFVDVQREAIASARTANGIDLGRASIRSPFIRLLRLSLGQAYGVIAAHNRRHIWIARRILQSPALPG